MRTGLVTTLKRKATELLADLKKDREPILITQHGLPSAICAMALITFLGCVAGQPNGTPANIQNATPGNSVSGTIATPERTPPAETKNHVRDPELESNKEKWRAKGISDYDFVASFYKPGTYRWAEPVLIKVRNGTAISFECMDVKFKENNESCEGWMDGYYQIDTVEKMFDYAQTAFDEEAYIDEIKYDGELGYPKLIWVNFMQRGVDQSRKLIVRKFEIQPKRP